MLLSYLIFQCLLNHVELVSILVFGLTCSPRQGLIATLHFSQLLREVINCWEQLPFAPVEGCLSR